MNHHVYLLRHRNLDLLKLGQFSCLQSLQNLYYPLQASTSFHLKAENDRLTKELEKMKKEKQEAMIKQEEDKRKTLAAMRELFDQTRNGTNTNLQNLINNVRNSCQNLPIAQELREELERNQNQWKSWQRMHCFVGIAIAATAGYYLVKQGVTGAMFQALKSILLQLGKGFMSLIKETFALMKNTVLYFWGTKTIEILKEVGQVLLTQ